MAVLLAKCPYCDFNSHVRPGVDGDAFARALVRELETQAAALDARPPLDSIFFGGGTPSLMPPGGVEAVIDTANRLFGFSDQIEITLEANPTSADATRFAAYREAGVNRISMGLQALNDGDLKALGRQHSVAEAKKAFGLAQGIFPRVSFDLIYARTGQSVTAWEAELREALALAADHLSLYQLTIEDGTKFATLHRAGLLQVPDSELAAELFTATQEICAAAGMPAYEISNHAAPGAESRHNLVYWRYGEFLGIGPGAHGRVRRGGALRATSTERQPETWLQAVEMRGEGLIETGPVALSAQADEYLVMALRLSEGLDLHRHAALGGRIAPDRLDTLVQERLVTVSGPRLTATRRGRLVLNAVAAELSRDG